MSQPGSPSQVPPQKDLAPAASPPGTVSPPPSASEGDNAVGMVAMVLGLLSLMMGCPLSIAAIVLGIVGRKKEPKGMATAGLVLGIVTLTLHVLIGCFFFAIYGIGLGSIFALAIVMPPIHNAKTFQEKAAEFEAHKAANGSYPSEAEGSAMMAGTRDGWGQPIVYRRDGEAYILVSPGLDGTLDNEDDVTFRASEHDPTLAATPGDSPLADTPTKEQIMKACELVQDRYDSSDDYLYPSDAEGQAVIDHLKDEWGNALVYRQTEEGNWGEVSSKGPDGILGTFDDVTSEEIYEQFDGQ